MKDHRTFLKIKLKSLAAEARIIRTEESKRHDIRALLHLHRVGPVRRAARNTQLAYGFLRGRTYRRIEPHASTPPDWKNVARMVKQYGAHYDAELDKTFTNFHDREREQAKAFEEWMNAATTPVKT